MQMVSSVLAAPSSVLGTLFSPSLADALNPGGIASIGLAMVILLIILAIPVFFLLGAIPMWVAAKIAVSGRTTYGTAIKVLVSKILAAIVITGVGVLLLFLIMAAGGQNVSPITLALIYAAFLLASIITNILIVAGAYDIGAIHAFGLELLSIVMAMVINAVLFSGGFAIFGAGSMSSSLQTVQQKVQDIQQNGGIAKALPSFNSPTASATPAPETATPPTATDYSAEIDNLLNTALHPDGPRPSLDERENIVRSLQDKLRLQKSMVPAGDAHAMLVFQNQLNRYMALLETVKLERKLHPVRNEVVTQKPVGQDYASPAQ